MEAISSIKSDYNKDSTILLIVSTFFLQIIKILFNKYSLFVIMLLVGVVVPLLFFNFNILMLLSLIAHFVVFKLFKKSKGITDMLSINNKISILINEIKKEREKRK